MNLIVMGCPGIGKTTISSKNKIFVDVKESKNIRENKIFLTNFDPLNISFLKSKKHNCKILILSINTKIASLLKERLLKRELQSPKTFKTSKVLNEINVIDKFSSLKFKKGKDVIIKKINNVEELNNLENILIEEYNKIKCLKWMI